MYYAKTFFIQNTVLQCIVMNANLKRRKMKYILRFRRHSKERFWVSEKITWYEIQNFLENIFEKTTQKYLEIQIDKCSG